MNRINQIMIDIIEFISGHENADVIPTDDPKSRKLGFSASYIEGELEYAKLFEIRLSEFNRCSESSRILWAKDTDFLVRILKSVQSAEEFKNIINMNEALA